MAPEHGQWRETSLNDAALFLNGYPFKPGDWSRRGTPIVRIAQMTGALDGCDRYNGVVPDEFQIDTGDLLFSWSGSLMVMIWDRGPAFLNQHIFKVIPRSGAPVSFLHHLLEHHMERLSGHTHGTTMRHITRADLLPYRVRLPPTPEQARIAEVLDTVDEAIRTTEQVIAKLEQVKRGLLHDLLTKGIDDNGEIRDPERHPEQFKDSPLGRIPKAWEVDRLSTWLREKPKNGYSPPPWHEPTGVLMLGLGCLTPSGFSPNQLKFAPPRDSGLGSAMLADGDLLVSRSNTRELVGLSGIYRDVGGACTYPDLMMRVRPDRRLAVPYLDEWMRSPSGRRQMQAAAVGTSGSMVKVSGRIVSNLVTPVPSAGEQATIVTKLDSARQRLFAEQTDLAKLRLLKKGLMDDLLTGRVRVPLATGAA